MRPIATLICALGLIAVAGASSARETAAAAAQVSDDEIKAGLEKARAALDNAVRRIEELEARLESLNGNLGAASDGFSSLSAHLEDLEGKSKEACAPRPGFPLVFQPYGYVKVDVIYDDARTSATDLAAFVLPEKPGFGSDRQFSVTVRQARLGVNILGPDIGTGKQTGKIEIDFYAPASVENKPELMLRQAYWQLAYPDWSLLVGNAGEVVSPLFPNSINYAYLALSGSPGYRKPMVRYGRTDKVFGDKTLQTGVALVRGIGSSIVSASSLDDEASDAAWPVLQSRIGISIPTSVGRPLTIGLSGHLGQEEYDIVVVDGTSLKVTSGKGDEYMTYSGNIDWKIPVLKELDFNGEFWAGRNLDAYMAGIGQGVNTGSTQGAKNFAKALNVPVDAIGGWGQFCYRPKQLPKWLFTVGAGIDDPDNNDLSGAVNRSRNATYFTNATYSLSDKTVVGMELSYMKTSYINDCDGDDIRVQTMLQYDF